MKRYTVNVSRSWRPTPSTHAIRVSRPDGFTFKAGQHAIVELATEEGPEDRFLSLASAPHDEALEFAVRVSDSAFKQRFKTLDPGDGLTLTGPAGQFTLDQARPALMISGGIGITPLISMIRHAAQSDAHRPITLIYANRDLGEIVFKEELDAMARDDPTIRVVYHLDHPPTKEPWDGGVGHVDPGSIRTEAARLGRPLHYICGPPGMVQAMKDHLTSLDVPPADIRREDFIGY